MTLPRGSFLLFRKIAPIDEDFSARERGQAVLRVIVSTIVTAYMAWASWPFAHGVSNGLLFALGYVAISAIFAYWISRSSTSVAWRRYAANFADVAAITVVMSAMGPPGAVLVLLYLWVTIGNGFRYGLPALFVSLALSLGGFAIAAQTSGLVQQHLLLATSMGAILLVLPAYTAHLIRVLHVALAEAREASTAKGQFLARMSHELRTPLNGITGAVDLLEASRRLTAEERGLLDVMRQSVAVSLRQINGVLDFSKLQAGKLVLEHAPFDLHDVLHGASDIVRPIAKQKGLRLFLRMSPEMPYLLVGDAHHLREILLNLLSNAVKFTERGAVWLEVSRVVDTNSPTKTKLLFEIGDTGIGMAPEALDHLFEPFMQADESTTRRYGGTGLGTSIAKQLAEMMGGRISVKSTRGEGTVFRCEIPFETSGDGLGEDRIAGARCLLVSQDNDLTPRVKTALQDAALGVVQDESEAHRALLRGLRVGNPVRVLLIDAKAAVSVEGRHHYQELCEKAAEAGTFPVLLAPSVVLPATLRDWGYAAVLSRDADAETLRTTVRAYAANHASTSENVVHLAPWRRARTENRPRILVADDNSTNLMIVQRMLERAGYEVEAVATGDAALRVLESGRCRLGILDMHMPGLDGLGVLRRYRLSRRHRVPIIILTADVGFEAIRDSAEAGAEAYLAKPATAAALLNEVERLLQQESVTPLEAPETLDLLPVVDESTLRELDRIYHDPAELSALLSTYETESEAILAEIARACTARNHPLFCDRLHALKGNAANVGALKLMSLCQETETAGVVPFLTEGTRLLQDLKTSYAESVAALREMAAMAPDHKLSEQ